MGKGPKQYDDDDLDYDDDYYDDDEYEEYDVKPAAKQPAAPQKPVSKLGASVGTKPGPQVKATSWQVAANMNAKYSVTGKKPATAPAAGAPDAFAGPSPDDAVRAAQAGAWGGRQAQAGSGAAAGPSAPAAPAAGNGAAAAARPSDPATLEAHRRHDQLAQELELKAQVAERKHGPSGNGAAAAAAAPSGPAPDPYRPVSEYRMDEELAVQCAIAASEEDEAAGGRPRIHLIVLGHVDAGKSTLMGRLLHDLGYLDQKKVHRNERDAAAAGKSSFSWAWALDERPEERARGVTIDVAVAQFDTAARSVTLLDAPGHRDFVPNMVAGASQADAAFVMVDGSIGGFEAGFQESSGAAGFSSGAVTSGQTREHLQLARSLGIDQLAIIVSKLDTCGFDQARFEFIRAQMEPFLKQLGFREAGVQWLVAVGPTGANLVRRPEGPPELVSWYRGRTVVEAIDRLKPRSRNVDAPLRLCVAEVIKPHGLGLGVSGKIEAGALRPKTKVVIVPGGHEATVKALEIGGKSVDLARAGDTVDVGLLGIEPENLATGGVVCFRDFPVRRVRRFVCQVVVIDPPVPVLKGQAGMLQAHGARAAASVTGLRALLDAKTGAVVRERPRCLLKGQAGSVEITVPEGVCLDEFSEIRALGRVVLRDGGRTVLAGVVTEVLE